MTARYAVIGNPVAHSRSPQIHTAFAAQTGQDIGYTRIEAPLDAFAATALGFLHADGGGLSVTVPFKTEALALATDSVSPLLDIVPAELHQRVPVVLGSSAEVERIARYHAPA